MTAAPFFALLLRPAVFIVGAFLLGLVALIVGALGRPEAGFGGSFDAGLVATFAFPAAAGWLFGRVIQDFQYASFAASLPGARRRLATGYLLAGLGVTLVTVLAVSRHEPATLGIPCMAALGYGAYCACAVLRDPLSQGLTVLNVAVFAGLVGWSGPLAGRIASHPWLASAVALVAGAAGVGRLFARRTFRLKPQHPSYSLPGSYSLERAREIDRRRRLGDRAGRSGWRAGYLGARPGAWVRAAFHEVHGGIGWQSLARRSGALWGLATLVVISAWVDGKGMSFPRALGYALYDALFRSPHVEPFGVKGGPYPMVMIVVASVGVVTALFAPVALGRGLLYPLSRRRRAQVAFLGALADATILFLALGVGLFVAGHLLGWLLGFGPRFDFMPYYLRVLLVTLALMPAGHLGRIALQRAQRRRDEHTLLVFGFLVVAFVVAVAAVNALVPRIVAAPQLQLAALAALFAATHLAYRSYLTRYYRRADLV